MTTMTAFSAKLHFGDVLDRVQHGEEVLITRYDKPVARIIPECRRSNRTIAAAVDGLLALQQRISARGGKRSSLSDAEVRAAIEEGRP